jgi:hypothetical protein
VYVAAEGLALAEQPILTSTALASSESRNGSYKSLGPATARTIGKKRYLLQIPRDGHGRHRHPME